MAVAGKLDDFRLDELIRAYGGTPQNSAEESNKVDSSEIVFFILLTSFLF